MKGEKVSTPLDKDGRGPSGLYNTHTVKALPPTSWHLTMFFPFFFFGEHRQSCSLHSPHSPIIFSPSPAEQRAVLCLPAAGFDALQPPSSLGQASCARFAITWTPRPPSCWAGCSSVEAELMPAPLLPLKHNLSQGRRAAAASCRHTDCSCKGRVLQHRGTSEAPPDIATRKLLHHAVLNPRGNAYRCNTPTALHW